ncbi:hypothetical protein [Haliangium sp.]|uniref:hypothetical protein n=1 Tax=Haliangium sp. TaxID=2663208 RepID=UPI003D0BEE72
MNHLPVFAPWDDGRPFLNAMNDMEPGYLLEGPEVSRDWMEQAYHDLDDEAKQRIADEWERLVNTLQVANEVTMTAMECAFKIGQKLQVGGQTAFEEKTTETILLKPQPAKEFDDEDPGFPARVAAMALWKAGLRPWQAMMGGLVVTVGLLVGYQLMDHADAMTTPIAMDDVAPLEIEPVRAATAPGISVNVQPDQPSPGLSAGADGREERESAIESQTLSEGLRGLSSSETSTHQRVSKTPASHEPRTAPQMPVRGPQEPNTRAAVSMGHGVQHLVLTPENATRGDDSAITLSIKPGVPRQVEGSPIDTRRLTIPDLPEFSLQLEIDPDLANGEQLPAKLKRKVTVTWSESRRPY